jgi:hypothetical protein
MTGVGAVVRLPQVIRLDRGFSVGSSRGGHDLGGSTRVTEQRNGRFDI